MWALIIAIAIIMPVLGLLVGLGGLVVWLVLSIILISLSVRIVNPMSVRTVEFLGKYTRILRQGLNFIVPVLEQTVYQDLQRKNYTSEVGSISSDSVSVWVGINIVYYVQDDGDDSRNGNIYKSIYITRNFTQILGATIEEQLRALISTFSHKEIFSKREEIGRVIASNLKEKLSEFGYTLDSIQVKDIKLENSVMNAMNRVVASERLKEAAINEWEADKIKFVKQAEADKESKILIGQWMAGQRMEIAKGFKESVDMIRWADKSLDGDKILKFLLDSSRIETLNTIGLSAGSKLIYLNEDLEGRGNAKTSRLVAGSDLMN